MDHTQALHLAATTFDVNCAAPIIADINKLIKFKCKCNSWEAVYEYAVGDI